MSERERCPVCDAPSAVSADRESGPVGLDTLVKIFDLCWVGLEGGGEHPRDPVDWRARALAAEQALARVRSKARAASDEAAQRLLDHRYGLVETIENAVSDFDSIVLLVDGDADQDAPNPIHAPHVVEDFEQMKRSDDARALLRANGWVESEPGEWSPATSETWAINVTQCSPEILRALAVLAEDAQP